MSNELKDLLKQELLDEVTDVGPLGVHELVWSLRGRETTLTDPDRVALAKQVARELLSSGTVMLYRLRWPSHELVSDPLTLDDVTRPSSLWIGAYGAVGARARGVDRV